MIIGICHISVTCTVEGDPKRKIKLRYATRAVSASTGSTDQGRDYSCRRDSSDRIILVPYVDSSCQVYCHSIRIAEPRHATFPIDAARISGQTGQGCDVPGRSHLADRAIKIIRDVKITGTVDRKAAAPTEPRRCAVAIIASSTACRASKSTDNSIRSDFADSVVA